MTTLHKFSRRKIQSSGGRLIWTNSLTHPASTTSVTLLHRVSSQMAFTTRATSGIACVHRCASPSSGFALRWPDTPRFLSWLMTTPATGFPAHRSGLINHIPSLALSRSASWSHSILCQRTSTFSIRQSRGLSCILTRMTAGDGFVVQLAFRHERSNTVIEPRHHRSNQPRALRHLYPFVASQTNRKPSSVKSGSTAPISGSFAAMSSA